MIWFTFYPSSLQLRHNEHVRISNHGRLDCLLNHMFRRRSKKISKLCVTGLCEGNTPVTGWLCQKRGKCFHSMTSSCISFSQFIVSPVIWCPCVKIHCLWFSYSRLCYHYSDAFNGCDGVSNHQPPHCIISRLFRSRSKKTRNPRVTGLCAGNSPMTGESPAQIASDAENISI